MGALLKGEATGHASTPTPNATVRTKRDDVAFCVCLSRACLGKIFVFQSSENRTKRNDSRFSQACRDACRAAGPEACAWWQLEVPSSSLSETETDGGGGRVSSGEYQTDAAAAVCTFKAARGDDGSAACPSGSRCAYGPAICPGS